MKKLISILMAVVVVLSCSIVTFEQVAFAEKAEMFESSAASFCEIDSDAWKYEAKYFEDANCFMATITLKSTSFTAGVWDSLEDSIKNELKDAFLYSAGKVQNVVDKIDSIQGTNTTTVITFHLMDGEIQYIVVNGVDLSSMLP